MLLEERNFIEQSLAGSLDAFSELVRMNQHMVYRVCLEFTKQQQAAEDLTQDTFVRAYESLETFRFESTFATWLYRIAARQCLNWRRRSMGELAKATSLTSEQFDALPALVSVENLVVAKSQDEALHRLIVELRQPYREVVEMFYFEGRNYEDIACRLGISIKTVESRLYRARSILRAQGGVFI